MKKYILLWLILSASLTLQAQSQCSNLVSTTDGSSSITLQKCLSTASPVKSGNPIVYTISFTISGGTVANLQLQDILPSNLVFLSESSSGLTFTQAGGTLTWNAASLSPGIYSISFTAKFPEGVTCNGAQAYNGVSVAAGNMQQVSTDPQSLAITAEANDGWRVRKVPRSNPILPGSTVTYDIYVYNVLGQIGSHNLSGVSITDLLPPGSILVSSNCNAIANLDVMAPGSGNVNSTPYRCQIQVTYPASVFPSGSCPVNEVGLSGSTPCENNVSTNDQASVCVVDNIPPNTSAWLRKRHIMANRVPGCPGRFEIDFGNNGTTVIPDLEMYDVFLPNPVDVQEIRIYNPNGISFDYEVIVFAGGPLSGTTSGGVTTLSPAPGTKFLDIKIGPNAFAPGQTMRVEVDFALLPSVLPGAIVNNTATLTSASEAINISRSTAFRIEAMQPKIKIRKEICPPGNTTYRPGDVFTYRLRLQNWGNMDFNGGILTDVLDPRLEFIGPGTVKIYRTTAGQTASPPCAGTLNAPVGTTDLLPGVGFAFNPANQEFRVNLPNLVQDCQSFLGLGWNLTNQLESYLVEFDVRVRDFTPPGNIPNRATVSNGTYTFQSNEVIIGVVSLFALTAEKAVSLDNGVTYTTSGSIMAGSTMKFRLQVRNTGNLPFTNLQMVDALPNIGDEFLQLCLPRGSSVNTTLVGIPVTSTNLSTTFSTQMLPNISGDFGVTCYANPPAWSPVPAGAKSLKFISNPGFVLNPGASETFYFEVNIPASTPAGKQICNDFLTNAKTTTSLPAQTFSSNRVCVDIIPIPEPDTDCCSEGSRLEFRYRPDGDITNLPNGAPWTQSNPLSITDETFEILNSNLIPITSLKVAISDFSFTSPLEACEPCINNPGNWASLGHKSGAWQQVGSGLSTLQAQADGGGILSDRLNNRELIWENPQGVHLNGGDLMGFNLILPPFNEIPCCAEQVDVCFRISWKDANCQMCDTTICTTYALAPGNLNDNSFSIVRKGPGEACCEDVVLGVAGDFPAIYQWSTGATTPDITVTENGTYTVQISSYGQTFSKSYTVKSILKGGFPTLAYPPQARPGQGLNLKIRDYSQADNAPYSYNANRYTLWIFNEDGTGPYQGAFRRITGTATCGEGLRNGEIQWDGRDDAGNQVQTGVYNFILRLGNCDQTCVDQAVNCLETHTYQYYDPCATRKRTWQFPIPYPIWKCEGGMVISSLREGAVTVSW